jgi:hypothetical protein
LVRWSEVVEGEGPATEEVGHAVELGSSFENVGLSRGRWIRSKAFLRRSRPQEPNGCPATRPPLDKTNFVVGVNNSSA